MSRQLCCSRASLYVISASCRVPSSNWQHQFKWPHVAEHNMALGNFICKPPRSFGKVKRAVDVFGVICQASLLHLTKAAVSFLNSFSGQIITSPEKARRGPRVQSISLRPFSIERSLFSRRKQATSVIPFIMYLLWPVSEGASCYEVTIIWCGINIFCWTWNNRSRVSVGTHPLRECGRVMRCSCALSVWSQFYVEFLEEVLRTRAWVRDNDDTRLSFHTKWIQVYKGCVLADMCSYVLFWDCDLGDSGQFLGACFQITRAKCTNSFLGGAVHSHCTHARARAHTHTHIQTETEDDTFHPELQIIRLLKNFLTHRFHLVGGTLRFSTRPRDRVQRGETPRYKRWANFLYHNQYWFC